MRRFLSFALSAFVVLGSAFLSSCKKKESVSTAEIAVEFDETDFTISGKAVYKLVNTTNNLLNDVKFNLVPKAYEDKRNIATSLNEGKVYYDGESVSTFEIKSIFANNKAAQSQTSEDGLTLSVLTGEVYPDEEVKVEINFEVGLPKANARLGATETTVNLADFYPSLCFLVKDGFCPTSYSPFGDPYFADVSNFKVSLTLPAAYAVASSGFPERTSIDGSTATYVYSLEKGRDFAFVLSKDFNVSTAKSGDTILTYYSVSPIGDDVEVVKDCVDYFSSVFGKFPYKNFSLAETGLFCDGTEFSGLSFVSNDLSAERKKMALVRQTAHQWWRNGVGVNEEKEGYIDEGLCEYATYLYLSDRGYASEAEETIENAKALYKSIFDVKDLLNGESDARMNRSLKEFKNENEYIAVAYGKSLTMFYELEKTIGRKKTLAALKKLYSRNLYETISLGDIIAAFGYGDYFESYVLGRTLP